jgi:hypothetical protein
MEINELYLKTAFCCMACDGDIAQEEVELVKQFASLSDFFGDIDVQSKLNEYVSEINARGKQFLYEYLRSISACELKEQEEGNLALIAIKMILADNIIEYSEISFFKRIRAKLKLTDESLLEIFEKETLFDKFPEIQPEDFLLPDVMVDDSLDLNFSFDSIILQIQS